MMKIEKLTLKLEIEIEPTKFFMLGEIDVKEFNDTPQFLINNALKIKSLELVTEDESTPLDFIIDEDFKDEFFMVAQLVKIIINDKLERIAEGKIVFQLQGEGITPNDWGTNYLTKDGLELGSYCTFYPQTLTQDRPSFDLCLKGPKDWDWKVNGTPYSFEDNEYLCWKNEGNPVDITLVGLPVKSIIPVEDQGIFWGYKENFHNFKKIDADLKHRKTILQELLGPCDSDDFSIAMTIRTKGGIYVRGSLMVTQYTLDDIYFTEKKDLLLLSWTHEIAHQWFCKTTIEKYHNWIDEGIADYTSLIIAEQEEGQEYAERRIKRLLELLSEKDLPPIKSITRSHQSAQDTFYLWGSLIFHKIRLEIGLEQFKKFLYAFAQKSNQSKKIETLDLIETLNEVTGNEWEKKIEEYITIKPSVKLFE